MLHVPGSRRGEYALSYSSDNDPSSLAVDAEGQMARFVTKTLIVFSGLVVLTYVPRDRGCCCCHW